MGNHSYHTCTFSHVFIHSLCILNIQSNIHGVIISLSIFSFNTHRSQVIINYGDAAQNSSRRRSDGRGRRRCHRQCHIIVVVVPKSKSPRSRRKRRLRQYRYRHRWQCQQWRRDGGHTTTATTTARLLHSGTTHRRVPSIRRGGGRTGERCRHWQDDAQTSVFAIDERRSESTNARDTQLRAIEFIRG